MWEFFEFGQSIVDIGNLFHCFVLFCSGESNLNVGRLFNIVLLSRDTNFCSNTSCYVKHFVAAGKLLIHFWLSANSEFQHRKEIKVFSIVNNSRSNCRNCFSVFTKSDLISIYELPQLIFLEKLEAGFPSYNFWYQADLAILVACIKNSP